MTRLPTSAELMELAQLTLRSPREGAAVLLRDMPPRAALWLILWLVVVFLVMAGEASKLVIEGPPMAFAATVALQAVPAIAMVFLVYHVGRAFGGGGSFDGALILVSWLQFIFVIVQAAQILLAVIMPPAAVLVAMLSIGLFFWLLVNFVAELHGFVSLARVFFGILGVLVPLSLVLAMLAGAMGFEFETGQMP